MTITTVEYRQLRSFGNYNNESVGAVAQVDAGERPDTALASLKTWVAGELGMAEQAEKLRDELFSMRSEKNGLERDIKGLKRVYGQLEKLLKKHGVKLRENVPF